MRQSELPSTTPEAYLDPEAQEQLRDQVAEAAGQVAVEQATKETEGTPEGFWGDEKNAAFATAYVDWDATQQARAVDSLPPLSREEFDDWVANLPPQAKADLDYDIELHANMDRDNTREATHEALLHTVPELYDAKLPKRLEDKLGGIEYAVGFNQTVALDGSMMGTAEQAADYLKAHGGVEVPQDQGYNLSRRFLMHDQDDTESLGSETRGGIADAIDEGYYANPKQGRFVAAFPNVHQRPDATGRLATNMSYEPERLPADALYAVQRPDGAMTSAYNSKYVAGFIDDAGTFWENVHFGASSQPEFVKYEPDNSESQEKPNLSDESLPVTEPQNQPNRVQDLNTVRQETLAYLEKGIQNIGNNTDTGGGRRLKMLKEAVMKGDIETIDDVTRIKHEVEFMRMDAKKKGIPEEDIPKQIVKAYEDAMRAIGEKPIDERTPEDKRTLMRAAIVLDANGIQPAHLPYNTIRSRYALTAA